MRKLLALTARVAGAGTFALLAGCAEPVPQEMEPIAGEAVSALTLPPPPPGATCVTLQRGSAGNVFDTDISPGNGTWAAGNYTSLWTGGGSSPHWLLAKPDLSPIPPESQIVSSTLSVYVGWNAVSSEVRAHRVTEGWAEATVNWPSFGGAASWDQATVGTFDPEGVGYESLDLTALTQSWYSGAVPNHGVLLEEDPSSIHAYFASESSSPSRRPRFDVCYLPGPCAGKEDGDTCEDGDPCTQADTCEDGACVPGPPKVCGGGECDSGTGDCPVFCPCRELADWHPFVEETACSYSAGTSASVTGDGDVTLYAQATADGNTCGSPSGSHTNLTAAELALCMQDLLAFDAAIGADGQASLLCACQVGSDGAACNDGDPCTTGDTCQGGACTAGQALVCDPGTVCSALTGGCVDPCATDPCQNGGACAATADGHACTCVEGYGGTDCDEPADPCAWGPCQNGGTCMADGLFYYTCACPDGFTGPECDIPVDPCNPDPCNEHGICVPSDGSDPSASPYTCSCAAGWQGTNCDIPTCPCVEADSNWSGALASPGLELIPTGLESILSQCHETQGTFDLSGFRLYIPNFDPATFAAAVAALDPSVPDYDPCVAMTDLVFPYWTAGFAGAGTVTTTIDGVTKTGTYCMGALATYETTADQNALCLGAVDAAGGGNVTTWTW